jgi:hypothetical protein
MAGYPASLFKIAAKYARMGEVKILTLFPHPPKFDNPSAYFHKKKEVPDAEAANPYHKQWGYLRRDYLPHYDSIRQRAGESSLALAMGDLAFWCLTGEKLLDHRGTITYAGTRVIGTHHPRSVVRDHTLLPILAMDMRKAYAESQKPRSVFPRRAIHIVEDPHDAATMVSKVVATGVFAFDIETYEQKITMICFAPSDTEVYVVPLDPPDAWKWDAIRKLMASSCRKIAHNAVYDLTYLVRHGIDIAYPVDDTMLLSHSHEIEWPKSLGFLGSIYCNERSWKLMRVGKVKDRNKKDE